MVAHDLKHGIKHQEQVPGELFYDRQFPETCIGPRLGPEDREFQPEVERFVVVGVLLHHLFDDGGSTAPVP